MANKNLHNAKESKNDEFYTQLEDIEKELQHYKEHFEGKVVFCNCDDPYESNFFKYFAMNFNFLKLKKLIATGYAVSPIAFKQLSLFDIEGENFERNKAYKIEITEVFDENGDGAINFDDIKEILKKNRSKNKITPLTGDGDFRSEESKKLLKQADIVVTNPPFSLFREYVSQLFEFEKKFLIIGNQNAFTYKDIFCLIRDDRLWVGYNMVKKFEVSESLDRKNIIEESGKRFAIFGNICWFTNLDIKKRHEDIELVKKYNPIDYPKYDNYDAIEVSKVVNIPKDYDGVMGVPITFLGKFNPDQFAIIDINPHFFSIVEQGMPKPRQLKILGHKKDPYARILIKNKKVSE